MDFRRASFASIAFALTAVGAAQEGSTSDPLEQLRKENADLAAKVARLEKLADDQGRWLTEARATEIRELVEDVLADASTRTSLQADGATAGWDNGFFIASPDGSFRLNIGGEIQFRFAYNRRDVPAGSVVPAGTSSESDQWGFENRRTKLIFAGHVIDPTVTYLVQVQFDRSYGNNAAEANSSLEYVWFQKAFEGGWSVRAGQFKAPFLREELVGTMRQQAIDRSLINHVFSAYHAQGVQLAWEGEAVRIYGAYTAEMRANATNPVSGIALAGNTLSSSNTSFNAVPTDYAFSGRAEWKVAGSWRQFRNISSPRGNEFGLLLGVSGMAQALRDQTAANQASSMWGVTADATMQFSGVSFFTYGVYRGVTLNGELPTRGGGSDDRLEQWGVLVQAGVFLVDDLELYLRYELGNTDTDQYRTQASALGATYEEASLLSVGVNFFPLGVKEQRVRWSSDIGVAFEALGDFSSSGANWLPDATTPGGSTERSQFVIRSQLSFIF